MDFTSRFSVISVSGSAFRRDFVESEQYSSLVIHQDFSCAAQLLLALMSVSPKKDRLIQRSDNRMMSLQYLACWLKLDRNVVFRGIKVLLHEDIQLISIAGWGDADE